MSGDINPCLKIITKSLPQMYTHIRKRKAFINILILNLFTFGLYSYKRGSEWWPAASRCFSCTVHTFLVDSVYLGLYVDSVVKCHRKALDDRLLLNNQNLPP